MVQAAGRPHRSATTRDGPYTVHTHTGRRTHRDTDGYNYWRTYTPRPVGSAAPDCAADGERAAAGVYPV